MLFILSLALLFPTHAAAWHTDGHMAIARIAWKQVDDRQHAYFAKLLKAHPHYELYLTAERPAGLPEIEWAFLRAATWPDWVRDPRGFGLTPADRKAISREFDKPVWHYVNLPYVHPADADHFDAAAIRKEILEPAFDDQGEPRHILAALSQCSKHLSDPDRKESDRAVRLCWMLHLVGDLHQPLHATSLIASKSTFDPAFDPPHGDLGGNRLAVKGTAGSTKATKLHFYWDALLFSEEPPFEGVETVVVGLLNEFKRDALDELKATEVPQWAEESLGLAKDVVYQGEAGFLKARALPTGKIELVGLDAPVLPDAYQKKAEGVARRRMALAGYRLADQLTAITRNAP
jgi:hypothetical protein